jgi:la-related protein 1
MDEEGFIGLDTIAGFNRMQQLIAYAYSQMVVGAEKEISEVEAESKEISQVEVEAKEVEAVAAEVKLPTPTWTHQFVVACIADSEVVELAIGADLESTKVRLREDWDKWLLPKGTVLPYSVIVGAGQPQTGSGVAVGKTDSGNGEARKETDIKIQVTDTTKLKHSDSPAASDVTLAMNDDDLFHFDESYEDRQEMQPLDMSVYDVSEFEDDDLDTILLVTQRPSERSHASHSHVGSHCASHVGSHGEHQNLPHRRHATSPFFRSKSNIDVADMISEGLFLYEKSFGKPSRSPGMGELNKISSVPEDTFAKLKSPSNSLTSKSPFNAAAPHVKPSPARTVGQNLNKRFFESENSASPPVGYFLDSRMGKSVPRNSYSSSYEHAATFSHSHGSNLGVASSYGASYKELTPFQHPSYELLQENGFIQHKYSRYHSKAIKGTFI